MSIQEKIYRYFEQYPDLRQRGGNGFVFVVD